MGKVPVTQPGGPKFKPPALTGMVVQGYCLVVSVLVLVNLTQALVIWEEGALVEKTLPSDWQTHGAVSILKVDVGEPRSP